LPLQNFLGDLKVREAAKPLITLLKEGKQSFQGENDIITALGDIEDTEASDIIAGYLTSNDDNRRILAQKALDKLGWVYKTDEQITYYLVAKRDWTALQSRHDSAVPYLVKILQSGKETPKLMRHIIRVLGDIRDLSAVDPFEGVS